MEYLYMFLCRLFWQYRFEILFWLIKYADLLYSNNLTFTLSKWRIWWAPNNASKWQMGFNSALKG
jgi:hypothetical protein